MGIAIENAIENKKLFDDNLHSEMNLLTSLLNEHYFSNDVTEGGFELELFIVNTATQYPKHINLDFLNHCHRDNIVPEFSDSTIEINSKHFRLNNHALSELSNDIEQTGHYCDREAKKSNVDIAMIGTLPTGLHHHFDKNHLTPKLRYQSLDDSVQYRVPILITINGIENLQAKVDSLASMGSCCSFQVHFRVSADQYSRYYNAAQALAGPILSVCCNSPLLFGKSLWDESRIQFLEQLFASPTPYGPYQSRTIFGCDYIRSVQELFDEDCEYFTRVLPFPQKKSVDELWHLRLHDSTIYRWNRPVLGIQADSSPHLRIEFRPLPSGPTTVDMIANSALVFGLLQYFAQQNEAIEDRLPFKDAKNNFYIAAQFGLHSEFQWIGNKTIPATELLSDLLSKAAHGLDSLGIDADESAYYLNIIDGRIKNKLNGSEWQKHYLEKNNNNYQDMLKQYIDLQHQNIPVHQWKY